MMDISTQPLFYIARFGAVPGSSIERIILKVHAELGVGHERDRVGYDSRFKATKVARAVQALVPKEIIRVFGTNEILPDMSIPPMDDLIDQGEAE